MKRPGRPVLKDYRAMSHNYRGKKSVKVPFSNAEIALIKRLFPKTETLEIADRLNRPYWLIKAKLRELGLSRMKKREWSKEQIKRLRKLYPTTSAATIANELGFNLAQVRGKAKELKLKRH